jgi:ankyrin repeat protein
LDDTDAISFLEILQQYQTKVQAIHKAIEQGNLRAVKLLTDRKKLAFCRNSRGLAHLHKAVVFEQTEIAKYLIRNYPQSVNTMIKVKESTTLFCSFKRWRLYV